MANLHTDKKIAGPDQHRAGRFLFVSPWVLGYAGAHVAAWTAWVSAVVIGALAVAAMVAFTEWEEWVNLALGIWVVLAPWILSFTGVTHAVWAHVVLGNLDYRHRSRELWQVRHEPHLAG